MKNTILKIGAEGGSLEFYKTELDGDTIFSSRLSTNFKKAGELFETYSKKEDPLLWYFPVEISEEIRSELLPVLIHEYREYGGDHFMNLAEWERKLNLKFSDLKPDVHQTFIITPIQKIGKNNNDSIGENQPFLESVTTIFTTIPKHRKELTGIGSVEGNTFVVRGEDGLIKGVFSIERYEVECK